MYTYIDRIGNSLYVSKYENGTKVYERDNHFQPYFFLKTSKETEYKTFPENENVDKVVNINLNEFNQAIRTYPRSLVVGNIGRELPIVEKIREDNLAKNFDSDKIKVLFYDIEVWSEKGFPHAEEAEHPIVTISGLNRSSNNIHLWALTDEFESIDWFKYKFPELNQFKTLFEVENSLMNAKKVFLKKYKDKADAVRKMIHEKVKQYEEYKKRKDEIKLIVSDPEELEHIEFFIEKDKEFIVKINKKIEQWSNIEEYFRIAKEMKIYSFEFEEELISHFISFVRQNEFDVTCGWNSDYFDDPYFLRRAKKLLGNNEAKKISPFNYLKHKELEKLDGSKIESWDIVGINQLDYIQLDKKYTQNKRDSYKLEDVSQSVAGIGKINYDGDLRTLWLNDKKKYCIYNIGDVECLEAIDKNLGYIDLMFSIAHYSGSNPKKFASTTAVWAANLFNRLLDENKIIPSTGSGQTGESIVGAVVYEPQFGRKEWILSEDLTSLYPSLIRFCNMSPETILHNEKQNINAIDDFITGTFDFEPWKKQKKIITPFGTVFDAKKEGFIPNLISSLFLQRKNHKTESGKYRNLAKNEKDALKRKELLIKSRNLNNIQLAEKILLNSFYGALQVKSFPLFDKDMAEAITTMGQVANMYCGTRVNKYINTICGLDENHDNIIAGDTDSFYLDVTPIVQKLPEEKLKNMSDYDIVDFLDSFEKKYLFPKIKEIYENMYNMIGGFVNTMNMDREIIGKGAFWKAKKRYAIYVYDNEGDRYGYPDMKIMGMQTVRSDTPTQLKPYMIKYIKRLVWGLDIKNYIKKVKSIFDDIPIEEIAIPKTINGIKKYYEYKSETLSTFKKKAPQQVKAAIHFNNLISKLNLEDIYQPHQGGDKAKILKLKSDNKYFIDTIAIKEFLPKEFDLDEYVDIDAHYQTILGKFFEDYADIVDRKDELYEQYDFKLF